jgi:hypothetical protein
VENESPVTRSKTKWVLIIPLQVPGQPLYLQEIDGYMGDLYSFLTLHEHVNPSDIFGLFVEQRLENNQLKDRLTGPITSTDKELNQNCYYYKNSGDLLPFLWVIVLQQKVPHNTSREEKGRGCIPPSSSTCIVS